MLLGELVKRTMEKELNGVPGEKPEAVQAPSQQNA